MVAIKCFCPEATLVGFAGGLKLVGRPETEISPCFLLEGVRVKCLVNSTEDKHAYHVCECLLSPTCVSLPLILLLVLLLFVLAAFAWSRSLAFPLRL